MIEYKVVELSTVTNEDIERAINTRVREGWIYDGMTFAMRDSQSVQPWPLSSLQETAKKTAASEYLRRKRRTRSY